MRRGGALKKEVGAIIRIWNGHLVKMKKRALFLCVKGHFLGTVNKCVCVWRGRGCPERPLCQISLSHDTFTYFIRFILDNHKEYLFNS